MSLLEQDHQEGAGVNERYEMYEMYEMYEIYEIADALPVTPDGLHPRWLDLQQSQLLRPPGYDCLWRVRTGGCQLSTIRVQ